MQTYKPFSMYKIKINNVKYFNSLQELMILMINCQWWSVINRTILSI
jgi:hypothetical protein